MPKHLIVGASGQLGAELCRQLVGSALPAARRQLQPDWLHVDLEEIAADPALLDGIFNTHDIDAVYCAAGATDVERCEADHAWAAAANHLGPLALAQRARDLPFIFFSTDYVFDGSDANPGPYAEDAATHPLSIYGCSKLDGERAILDAHPQALVLRTTTVYGPDPQAKNFLYTLRRLLTEGKTMRLSSDQLATPTYNADLAAASIALVAQQATGIVHIAGPEFLSRMQFAQLACDILSLDASLLTSLPTSELGQKAARPLLGGLRINKLNALLGNAIMRAPSQGIRDWQQSNSLPS